MARQQSLRLLSFVPNHTRFVSCWAGLRCPATQNPGDVAPTRKCHIVENEKPRTNRGFLRTGNSSGEKSAAKPREANQTQGEKRERRRLWHAGDRYVPQREVSVEVVAVP